MEGAQTRREIGMTRIGSETIAAISGGASGIGFALAQAFAAKGARLVLADRDGDALARARHALTGKGAAVEALTLDVAEPGAAAQMAEAAEARWGPVDLAVANAGIYPGMRPVWEMELADWRALFEINFWGAVAMIREFTPGMVARGAGHMVATCSMSGLSTVPGSADYGSAKHGLIATMETLRADLDLAGHRGVGVTILCPSLVMTEMGRFALTLFDDPGRDGIGSGPDLRAVLSPEALAEAAVEGIEAGRLHVLPTPASRARFMGRVQGVLDDFDAYPAACRPLPEPART